MSEPTFLSALASAILPRQKTLSGIPAGRGGWWPIVGESFSGAWQRNVTVKFDSVAVYHAVYACMTLIASDIAKLRVKLVAKDSNDIWTEVSNPAYSPVLRKPNKLQNRIQFYESWVLSKLSRGNAYILKGRDNRGVVTSMYVLDPNLVRPLVSDSGDVFYELSADALSGVTEQVVVPAREIIHDRYNCIFHPLIGTSPIVACGLSAMQGLYIQQNSARFFEGGATAPGILTAPGAISDDTAKRLKEHWETNYTGDNSKKVAVLGDGLKYERMSMTSVESQLIEQLKWTAEVVCSTFHVPPYKISVGQLPSYNNIQSLNVEYYSQCLQSLIEAIELCLDEGLGTGESLGTEFDLDGLLRMDSATQMDVLEKAKGKLTPNEQRKRLNAPPVAGGDTVYMQEQDHSLEWLSRRDAQPIVTPAPEPATTEPDPEQARAFQALFEKDLREALNAA